MKRYIKAASLQTIKNKILKMFDNAGCTNVTEVVEKSGNGSIYYNFLNPNKEPKSILIVFDYSNNTRTSTSPNYEPFTDDMQIKNNKVYDIDGNYLGELYVKTKKKDIIKIDRNYDPDTLRTNINTIDMKDINNQQSFNNMISTI